MSHLLWFNATVNRASAGDADARMLSACMCVCVCMIDIHWAGTFPYETQVSPAASTCEALHPGVGYQSSTTHLILLLYTKRSSSGCIWNNSHFSWKWLTVIEFEHVEMKALKGAPVLYQCRCTQKVFCCFQVLPSSSFLWDYTFEVNLFCHRFGCSCLKIKSVFIQYRNQVVLGTLCCRSRMKNGGETISGTHLNL